MKKMLFLVLFSFLFTQGVAVAAPGDNCSKEKICPYSMYCKSGTCTDIRELPNGAVSAPADLAPASSPAAASPAAASSAAASSPAAHGPRVRKLLNKKQGNTHDIETAFEFLDELPWETKNLLADKGYDSDLFRASI